jgi:hypothetical protein
MAEGTVEAEGWAACGESGQDLVILGRSEIPVSKVSS